MLGPSWDVKGVSVLAISSLTVDNQFSFAASDEVEFVLVMKRLMVLAMWGEKNQPYALFLKGLDIPDAFGPFIICLKRQLGEIFVDREFHRQFAVIGSLRIVAQDTFS